MWDEDQSYEMIAQVWAYKVPQCLVSDSPRCRAVTMSSTHTHDFTLTLTHSHQTLVLLNILLMTVSFSSHDVRCLSLTLSCVMRSFQPNLSLCASVGGVWCYTNDHLDEEEVPELSVLFNLHLNETSELCVIISFTEPVF